MFAILKRLKTKLIISWLVNNLSTVCGDATLKRNTVRVLETPLTTLRNTRRSFTTACSEKVLAWTFARTTLAIWLDLSTDPARALSTIKTERKFNFALFKP